MTEIATIDWFGRWGTSVFCENTAIFSNSLNRQRNNYFLVFELLEVLPYLQLPDRPFLLKNNVQVVQLSVHLSLFCL